ncbi:MAG: ankyrin repeat domain-containing protein [Luteolibacter sp.]
MTQTRAVRFFQTATLLVAVGFSASCDTPQKRGLRELAKAGIEPSAKSLVQAAVDQDAKRVGWLLDVGVYTEQRDAKGRTPVRIAIENSDLPSVFRLLDAKANVNAATPDQVSPLGVAVERGETAIVEKLLNAGARTDGLMLDGEKILPWSIRQGRLTFVRAMMKAGADPHSKDRSGNPLLHVAMEAGRRDLMETLIELGADPGATNAAGETTIHLAFRKGWLDAVPKLTLAGADPNARGPDGSTLLEKAVAEENTGNIALLLKIGANPNHPPQPGKTGTPLDHVFASGNTALLELFLNQGAAPAQGNLDSWLWQAFQNRDRETAHLLLRHGADASRRGAEGLLMVEAAVLAGHGSFVKLLLDYGNPAGFAMPIACSHGDIDMVSLLLALGVDPNKTLVPSLETPLSLAIRRQRDLIASTLIRGGADTSLRLPGGQGAFHLAIATGCPFTVKELLDSGVNANAPFALPVSPDFLKNIRPGVMRWSLRNERNVTPLMVAVDGGDIQTARYLIKAGAKVQAKTRPNNLYPINFAIDRKDVKMTRLILGKDPHREERQIVITLSEQRARLLDADGNELFTTKVSTGRKGYSTPTGEYVITDKNRDWTSTIYHASMPYFQRLNCSDFGLHQGVVPGYPASHGCIRVPEGNAAKLFTMTQAGDRVKIIP